MNDNLIIVENLYKTYGTLKAVDALSFEVEKNICCGFLGPNGAGKTTTMKMLYGGLLRDNNPETRVMVLGYDPYQMELPIKYLSGVVPQENNLDKELNVRQNLLIFAKFYNIGAKQTEKRIDELLDFLELKDKKQAKIKELSGGMQRRLTIARALLNKPKLLILDEPTTGLDPQVRHLIWDKLRSLKREGVTILLTTHYMEEAFQISDKIIIMNNGKKLIEGNPRNLLADNIEKHVLEILKVEGNGLSRVKIDTNIVRKDEAKERILFYSDDLVSLQKIAQMIASKDHHLRETHLEDLFLKITGRGLNE